ncbi:cyclase [Rhodobacteraceae bacterium 2CG4]|uniref:Cyclase n=1 Tax=Halovulum marinum TaxID=2662447 RepID=A0A6L5Z162_9RHOB|nr:SRPBCC family protein [Halovulum marinum]MSU90277.1 cyclase [Halovulum marinum]
MTHRGYRYRPTGPGVRNRGFHLPQVPDGAARAAALTVGAGVLLVGAATLLRATTQDHGVRDSAPGRTSRQSFHGAYAVTGRSVTVNRPRAEIFAFWRDFANLARFMENVERVETRGEQSVWTISAPAGATVTVRTRVVSERPDEEIAWQSTEDSDIDTRGKVLFRDAPGGRGTIVEAIVAYRPPGGQVGRLTAKLFQKEPAIQSRRDLKRLKMFLETGEVATSQNRKAA